MKTYILRLSPLGILALASCVASGVPSLPVTKQAAPANTIQLQDVYNEKVVTNLVNLDLSDIKVHSCPQNSSFQAFEGSVAEITAINAAIDVPSTENLNLVGVWRITSNSPHYHGLSGLTHSSSGDLIAVSDAGAVVQIELQSGLPTGQIRGARINGPGQLPLTLDFETDAEAVTQKDGIYFASFEQFARVDAYAWDLCGAAAVPVRVATLPLSVNGSDISGQLGPKAIGWTKSLRLFFETQTNRGGSLGIDLNPVHSVQEGYRNIAAADWFYAAKGSIVGMTEELSGPTENDSWHYNLRQAHSNQPDIQSVSVEVVHTFAYPGYAGTASFKTVGFELPDSFGRFEAIAAQPISADTHRVWLLSDNGLVPGAFTTLIALDVDAEMSTDGPGGKSVASLNPQETSNYN